MPHLAVVKAYRAEASELLALVPLYISSVDVPDADLIDQARQRLPSNVSRKAMTFKVERMQ